MNVIGSSPIYSDNISASRQRAIDISLEAAVSRAIIDKVPGERLTSHFQTIGDTLLKQIDQYIDGYKVLTESSQGKVYRVLVQATISMDRLTQALTQAGIARGQKSEMRVLICVAEKKVTDLNYLYWWGDTARAEPFVASQVLAGQLRKADIAVVPVDARYANTSGVGAQLSGEQALALARQLDANVVVVGRAAADEAPNTMGNAMRAFRGVIDINAYFTESGEAVTNLQYDELVASDDLYRGGEEALRNVALHAGERLANELQEAWLGQGSGTATLEIVIEGTGGHIANFVKFRGALGTMSGVDSMQLKEMLPDSAVLSVVYQGNARSLAEALLLKSFDTFGINIIETGARYIRLRLVPH